MPRAWRPLGQVTYAQNTSLADLDAAQVFHVAAEAAKDCMGKAGGAAGGAVIFVRPCRFH